MVVLYKFTQVFTALVEVLKSLINTILPNVLSWEHKTIRVSYVEGYSVMTVINLRQIEFLKVSYKPRKNMAFGHVKCR